MKKRFFLLLGMSLASGGCASFQRGIAQLDAGFRAAQVPYVAGSYYESREDQIQDLKNKINDMEWDAQDAAWDRMNLEWDIMDAREQQQEDASQARQEAELRALEQ